MISFVSQSYFGIASSGFVPSTLLNRSSFESSAISHVICCPVYAAIRPMIASSVLFAMYSPLLIGLPVRMTANSSSCSVWYRSLFGPSNTQLPCRP